MDGVMHELARGATNESRTPRAAATPMDPEKQQAPCAQYCTHIYLFYPDDHVAFAVMSFSEVIR